MSASSRPLDKNGFTTLSGFSWPDAFAGATQTPRKFGFENNGTRVLGSNPGPANGLVIRIEQVGTNDGASMLRIAADSDTLSPPYGVSASLGPSGDGGLWTTTGTRGYKVTAFNDLGETVGSFEVTINVDTVTKRVTLTWTQIPNAEGYKVYRTNTPGTYVSPSLAGTLTGASSTTFVDNGDPDRFGSGIPLDVGAPPTENTTGGWTLSLTLSDPDDGGIWPVVGNRFYRVVAYNSGGVEIANSLEARINVDNVTKRVTVSWDPVPGAAKYRVFRSGVSGTYTNAFRAEVDAPITSFVDNGANTTPPSLTTTPSFGIPPETFGTASISVETLAIGQHVFYWAVLVIPAPTPETGNRRAAVIALREV